MNKITVQAAFKRREMFLELHGTARLMEIKLLHKMWVENDWESLGFESFKDFVEAPTPSGGLDISRSWAVELILTYQKYVVELGLPENTLVELSPRKLYFLKGQATKENIKDILSRAETMTLTQLQIDAKHVNAMECEHNNKENLSHCLDCGAWIKDETLS